MDDAVTESLILDLLECVASSERSYEEVMDAWHRHAPDSRFGRRRMSADLL
jgi:hypothetical protein